MQRPYNQDVYTDGEFEAGQYCSPPSLQEAIKRSQDFLLSQQFSEGFWWAELESNASSTAQTVILYKILGVEDKFPMQKFEKYLRRTQQHHGGWEVSYGDGGYLSETVESYVALRLLNIPQSDPALKKARNFIIDKGGITKARMFTKICLALLGCFDWRGIPSLPPWLMLLPIWTKASIYEVGCWARGCVVALIVINDKKPVFKVSPEVSFDELYAEGKEPACQSIPFSGKWTFDFFVALDRIFKVMVRWEVVPFRERGLREAEKWLLERQEDTGDFVGAYPPMFYSVICMITLGYKVTDPVVQRALLSIKRFSIETPEECSVQTTLSPVWDTAFTVRALVDSGIRTDHPALQKAGEWLLQKQVTKHGDWAFKNRRGHVLAGGWAFQFFNKWYPDIDDSAVVVMALMCITLPAEDVKNAAIARCIKWISSMQSRCGGWAAFDKDSHQHWLNSIPFSDMNATLDPSTADVSARVLEMAGRLKLMSIRYLHDREDVDLQLPPETIARGLAYLRREQESEGCWYGRWGVNYIYGTCGALVALSLVAPTTHKEEIARGAKWLVQVQRTAKKEKKNGPQADGGWGETCFSYSDPALKGQSSTSTASQTAWALIGLLAAGDALGSYEAEAIEQGVQYLLSTQRSDGSWHEAQFTGTGFPGHFYLRYHFYAQHFTLTSLARHRICLQASAINTFNVSK